MSYFELYNLGHSAILDDFAGEGEVLSHLRDILERDGAEALQSMALVAVENERRVVVARQQELLDLVRPSTIAS